MKYVSSKLYFKQILDQICHTEQKFRLFAFMDLQSNVNG